MSNHFDSAGNARMVDVSAKPVTVRTATAAGRIVMRAETAAMIQNHQARKGDVLGVARIAAIQAVKLTPSLIPLCHAIPVDGVDVRLTFSDDRTLDCEVEVRSTGRTGVEMEALCGVATACLTVYDMCKSVDREMTIQTIRLIAKSGGKSGSFTAP
ncbi:MAG: cyclic pyranopterin monophosphate synthase MoaC [Planctomycetaceae bacterium]